MKKGDISIGVIIMAVIGLVVLIVLIAIFTGKFSTFSDTSTQTTDNVKNRVCAPRGVCTTGTGCSSGCPTGMTNCNTPGAFIDCGKTQVCCARP